ncbi:MAG: site-specific DNA-methyltransferase [Prevotellaceae bacterium]|nr:site-specific DNA-methyltransferase [Prevotellaceae bacterium]
MKVDKDNWRDIDINIDSLWLIGPGAEDGKRENYYPGNFEPRVPDHLIRRYTEEGEVVMDMFMGSGTALFECERLKRNYIGFDINGDIIKRVKEKMRDDAGIYYFINECDVNDLQAFHSITDDNLRSMGAPCIDFLLIHPPYWNIIKYTDKPKDLSNIGNLKQFIRVFTSCVQNGIMCLRRKRYLALVIGDVNRKGEVIPLGFFLMYAIIKYCRCKLKGIVVKDIAGNKGKPGVEALWRYRTLKSDTFLLKHEYIMVFQKD